MAKSEWVEWIKCNILEIIILILVLILVVNTFSTETQIQEKIKGVSIMEGAQGEVQEETPLETPSEETVGEEAKQPEETPK